jgi:hypothetical protein
MHRGDGFRLRKYRNQRTEGHLAGDWQRNGRSAGSGPGLHVAQSCHIEVYRLTGDHGIALGDQAQEVLVHHNHGLVGIERHRPRCHRLERKGQFGRIVLAP